MKKKELIEQLTVAKQVTSTVDIDKVIAMIEQLESTTLTWRLGNEIVTRIERCLDNNSSDLVDLDSAEFELNYDNRIELNSVQINVDDIVEHITGIVGEYVELENEDDECGKSEEEIMKSVNQGLGLEPNNNSCAE
jgi:hypothetical protein